jgi:hypothetical protein
MKECDSRYSLFRLPEGRGILSARSKAAIAESSGTGDTAKELRGLGEMR